MFIDAAKTVKSFKKGKLQYRVSKLKTLYVELVIKPIQFVHVNCACCCRIRLLVMI